MCIYGWGDGQRPQDLVAQRWEVLLPPRLCRLMLMWPLKTDTCSCCLCSVLKINSTCAPVCICKHLHHSVIRAPLRKSKAFPCSLFATHKHSASQYHGKSFKSLRYCVTIMCIYNRFVCVIITYILHMMEEHHHHESSSHNWRSCDEKLENTVFV